MADGQIALTVRPIDVTTTIVAIQGDLSINAERALMDAYAQACGPDTRIVVLDFSGLDYMNSGGIGLLVTLRVRMNRQEQRLLAFGLSEHYRHIFELTRLSDVIGVYDDEAAALAAAQQN
jgi:anti-sigma B factor antagonist